MWAGGKFIKRVIALPGETWEEREGSVYVNGRRLTEPYVKAASRDSRTIPRQGLPLGHYFLMGDNRIQSCDSREWGAVGRHDLVGVGVAVVRGGVILSLR